MKIERNKEQNLNVDVKKQRAAAQGRLYDEDKI